MINYVKHCLDVCLVCDMKNYWSCLCLIFGFLSASAQIPLNREHYADSLINRLKKDIPDTARAKTSFLLSEFYLKTDSVSAKEHLFKGIKYSKGSPFMEAVSLYYKGLAVLISNKELAEKMILQADNGLKKFNTKEAYLVRSMCWHNYAFIQHTQNNPKSSIEIILHKAIPLAVRANDSGFLGKNFFLLSVGFKNLLQFEKEKIYLDKAISVLKNSHSPQYLAMVYQSIGENYTALGKLKEAKVSFDEMKALLVPYPKSDMWLDYYAGEAFRLNVALQFDSALAASTKGIALAKNIHTDYIESRLELQKFYALQGKKDFLKARDVALRLSNNKQFMSWDVNRILIYEGLASSYDGMNNPTASYKWLRLYTKLNDSLNNKKLKEAVSLLEVKYRTAESQKKIVALNAENEKTKLAAKNSLLMNWLLVLVSLFLLVLAILGWLYYRNSKKLAIQKDLNHQQELQDIERQQELKLVEVMLNAKEDEQNRVARDLHDGLGGMLAVSRINLAHYVQESKNTDEDLQNVILQLGSSLGELRRIAHNMMPEMLLRLGLESSLRDLCESVASENLKVNFQCLGIQNDIKSQEQINIYRIVQEAMANVAKHANAKNLLLQCSQNKNIFFITIEDDGKGFDTSYIDTVEGIGVRSIKSRVEYLKGKIEILSQENKPGTSINIELYVTT